VGVSVFSTGTSSTNPPATGPAVGRDISRAKEAPQTAAAQHTERKRHAAEQRRREQAAKKHQDRIAELEAKIAEREQAMKDIEATMSAPGFYENRDQAQPLIDRHQSLMWELGDLMHEWEDLQK
jgi:molecular chaperone GrpE (heat shock protein)